MGDYVLLYAKNNPNKSKMDKCEKNVHQNYVSP